MSYNTSITAVYKRSAKALLIWAGALILLVVSSIGAAFAANPPPVQVYYVPVPEDQVYQAFKTIYPDRQQCSPNIAYNVVSPIKTYISISIIADETIIYYDHWEDDFEVDVSIPLQPTTQIWGDGNPANGSPPGYPGDVLVPGDIVVLDNNVVPATRQSVIDFDGGDKLGSTRSIALTRTTWASGSTTLLAGAVEVYDTGRWGQSYTAPVGQDVAVSTKQFEYSGMAIMASEDGTSVAIDKNSDGAFETTITLDEGESHLVNGGVLTGAKVSADAPVQTTLITGDICEDYESRWYALFPDELLDNSYYSPVGTPLPGDGTRVFIHNSNPTQLTIYWQTVNGAETPLFAPAGGTVQATIPNNSGARFYSADGRPMSALAAVDATSSSGYNSRGDWGFTLVPESALTAQAVVGWAPGQDPTKTPTENGSPVWVTPVLINGGTGSVTVCVDYNNSLLARAANRPADANGFNYDTQFTLNPLQSQKIFDPDGNQTGMMLYVCDQHAENGTAALAVAWGQAPGIATRAAPGLDLGTTVPPASLFITGKSAGIANDNPDDGIANPGDIITYDIVIRNASRFDLPVVSVADTVPQHTTYVWNTTTFDDGASVSAIADNVSGTRFPLDNGGMTLPELPINSVYIVTFQVVVDSPFPIDVSRVDNQATVTIGHEIRRPEVETPVEQVPGIAIEKSTNGEDANTPPGPTIPVGDPVAWVYAVSNTGITPVTNVIVTDNVNGINPAYMSGDANFNNALDSSEVWRYEATGVATEGQYANVGEARGRGPANELLSDTDSSHYFGVSDADYSISKLLTSFNNVRIGDVVTFTIHVENTGGSTLTTVPLEDTYDTEYLSFVDAYPEPDSDADTGILTWTDLTAASPYGVGHDLSSSQWVDVIVGFFAIKDTTALIATGGETINTATGRNVRAGGTVLPDKSAEDGVTILNATEVQIVDRSVTLGDNGVQLQWRTLDESNIAAFHLYRTNALGVRTRITENPLPAQQSGQPIGVDYAYVDADVDPTSAVNFRYALELTMTDSSTTLLEIGAVHSGPQMYLPLINR